MKNPANRIISCVGGKENIVSLARCMSRLRFLFRNEKDVDFGKIREIREVLSITRCGDEICFVIKKGLPYLYETIKERIEDGEKTAERAKDYIRCYKTLIIISAILSIINSFFYINFSIIFPTLFLSFLTGMAVDRFLKLIKFDEMKTVPFGIGVIAPIRGRITDDGDGYVRLYPQTEDVVSPVDGVIEDICHHAVYIRADRGFGVFVHVGIDTINSKECFVSYVDRGDRVKKGEIIMEFDSKKLIENGYSLSSLVEITDYEERWRLVVEDNYASEGRALLWLVPN